MGLEDERIRFYFRHREQIEQWAALRSEAAAAVDEWMLLLGADVEALASSLGSDVKVHPVVEPDQAYPAYRLVRSGWGFDTSDPPACISLEWIRARTTMNGVATPYVGLRSPKSTAVGTALRASEAARQVRAARKDTSSVWWFGYSYVRPAEGFPEGAEAYREQLIEAVRSAWLAYEAHVALAARRDSTVEPLPGT